jgi:chemotaxis protein methyltransferase CheR
MSLDTLHKGSSSLIRPIDFDLVSQVVRARSAIVLDRGKEYLVEARLLPLVRREGFASLGELVDKMRREPNSALVESVVELMTTNETSFFRDQHPFEALRHVILPDLFKRRDAVRQLRFWSAACSSGQEAYSLLMTMREHFPQSSTWDVKVVGTDLSRQMVRRAAEGRFNQIEVNRGLPMSYLLKYLRVTGVNWQVVEELRRRCEFREMNLVGTWPALPLMDVVFLRNVLIYFDVAIKREILARIRKAMRPDGYLLLGSSESMIGLDEGWKREQHDRVILWRP